MAAENKSKVVTKVNYNEAVEYIFSVPKFTKKNKMDHTQELMERLGRPERSMKVIHVAGTNGKGSVCAFLSEILDRAGKRVGLFTSPHLVRINERFQINNVPISDDHFLEAYEKVNSVIQEMQRDGFAHPTYFELLFATAMIAFQNAKAEYVVLETGLGGRLDATNVVEQPLAVVITSISLDHTEILGDTIEKIAWEKAGIIKPCVPVIYDARNSQAGEVIRRRAQELRAPAVPLYENMYEIHGSTDKSIDFSFRNEYYGNIEVTVPYLADYQVINSSLALLAMQAVDPKGEIPVSVRVEGIRETRWQGRMETVLPGVILDGAHNAAGVEEFIRTVQKVEEERRVVMLFSAVAEKNYKSMIETICKGINPDAVVVTQVHSDRAVPAGDLANIFRSHTKAPVTAVSDLEEAFGEAMREKQDGLLFCVGSLYLVGELKHILEERNK